MGQCLKFKTYSSIFLNRFEALNLNLIEKMQNRQRPVAASTVPIPAADAPSTNQASAAAPVEGVQVQTGGVKTGGVKKKKGKKK